jgi:hypothetical protein
MGSERRGVGGTPSRRGALRLAQYASPRSPSSAPVLVQAATIVGEGRSIASELDTPIRDVVCATCCWCE